MSSTPSWTAHAGAAYLAPSGPGNHSHLFVILNDPMPFPSMGAQGCVCVVGFSSVPSSSTTYDTTCVFQASDHPFIVHASFAYYRYAQALFAGDVEKNIASGIWTPKPPDFDANQVKRLKDGLFASQHTSRYLKSLKI
ncbi:hypothetical protein E1956_44675 (plasmid) [Paraburkholderia pallida]|uniref:Uncharacterized protein n=1 Tax=Paraburkholderia pallida TaxID=2547399 RepID=A0A4P7DBA1_9BURK|nr:hypothetical protein E1956_44675 [Paraburkholderia pallida]